MDKISSESEWFSEWVIHPEPAEEGIPVQTYGFSRLKEWAGYEGFRLIFFDHILSVLDLNELRIFQILRGDDTLDLADRKSN
ncbi:MAG: hypothetical protein ACOCZI_00880 [Marinilabiliaceae bacterium]